MQSKAETLGCTELCCPNEVNHRPGLNPCGCTTDPPEDRCPTCGHIRSAIEIDNEVCGICENAWSATH